METTPATDKTQPISASHSPSSSRMRTSTSTLLSERFSSFVSDDKLVVLSKGVVASLYTVLSSGYSKSGLSEWIA